VSWARPSSSGGGSSSSSGGGSSSSLRSSASYPIERPTDQARLQPLAEAAASEDGLEGAAASQDTLAAGVSKELAAQIDCLHVGLALQMAQHHITLAEYEAHWGSACMTKMLTRADFLFRVSGRTMHMSPPTRDLPEGLGERNNETRVFFFHYPPPPSARCGFTNPDGHATDVTTMFCERAAQSAVPEGISYPWICQIDVFTDLFECSTNYKAADGTDFSYATHYRGTLSAEEMTEDETTKVEVLASMMVAERVLRGRSGAIAYVAGEQPDMYAPSLLKKAATMATVELRSEDASAAAYTVRRPTDLPEAKRATSKKGKKGKAGTASRVDHTCQALGSMPLDQRKRNDATITQLQGDILAGVPVRFFESLLVDKTEGGEGARLRCDAHAMTAPHPYTGPFPPTNETEAAARQAAISAAMSVVKRGGKELVQKAEAGDKEAAALSKRKAEAGGGSKKRGAQGKRDGARGGKQVRVSEDGTKRQTKSISALSANTLEQVAQKHFSTLGLSAVNPLGRCDGCLRWNLTYPVFTDDRSRASGVRKKHTARSGATTKQCGTFRAVCGSVSELTENLTLAERLAAKSGKGKAAKKVRPPPPPAPPPPP
jgi:hypothetical protein